MNTSVRDIDVEKTWVLASTLNFTCYFFKKKTGNKFIIGSHHRQIGEVLDQVIQGKIKKLMINIAPRYGKTELAVKNFIAYGIALNAKSKFIHLSYSDDLVLDNSKEINTTVASEEFQRLFEATPTSISSKKWYTEQGGGLYAVSSSGQVTGFGAGVVDPEKDESEDLDEFTSTYPAHSSSFAGAIIIDDPIKPDDALSYTIREKINQKFETTIRNRVNSRNTPIIIIMQRVHENDLCGYLLNAEPGEWHVLSLPCLRYEGDTPKALWPHKHTVDELLKIKAVSSFVFETQYQQDPKPREGLMYQSFRTYEVIPMTEKRVMKAYVDTADTGDNYLCSIVYKATENGFYVTDVIYTQAPMEVTEKNVSIQFTKCQVIEADIESNNGGRGFARNVERNLRMLKNYQTKINWFHQSENKEVRIFTYSGDVQNMVFYPENWSKLWPGYYNAMTGYMVKGKNAFDDAPDATTGIIEKNLPKNRTKDTSELAKMFH